MTPMDELRLRKTAEAGIRRAAARQRLKLERSRMRDPRGIGYGTYRLVDADTGEVYADGGNRSRYGLTLQDVARILDQGRK